MTSTESNIRTGLRPLELPWLSREPTGDRIIPRSMAYWEPERGFHVGIERPNGYLEFPGRPVNGIYLSRTGRAEELWSYVDSLGTLIVQRASFAKTMEALRKVHADQINLAACMEKHQLILKDGVDSDRQEVMQALLETEFEYLFGQQHTCLTHDEDVP